MPGDHATGAIFAEVAKTEARGAIEAGDSLSCFPMSCLVRSDLECHICWRWF